MASNARDRARSLELIIRAAVAEERLLGRRLDHIAEAHRKVRADSVEARPEPASQAEDGSSER
jgi:hypothetical protein